ncbi:hypothetical protein LTR66_016479, partial [Elasticomyces elasticus]
MATGNEAADVSPQRRRSSRTRMGLVNVVLTNAGEEGAVNSVEEEVAHRHASLRVSFFHSVGEAQCLVETTAAEEASLRSWVKSLSEDSARTRSEPQDRISLSHPHLNRTPLPQDTASDTRRASRKQPRPAALRLRSSNGSTASSISLLPRGTHRTLRPASTSPAQTQSANILERRPAMGTKASKISDQLQRGASEGSKPVRRKASLHFLKRNHSTSPAADTTAKDSTLLSPPPVDHVRDNDSPVNPSITSRQRHPSEHTSATTPVHSNPSDNEGFSSGAETAATVFTPGEGGEDSSPDSDTTLNEPETPVLSPLLPSPSPVPEDSPGKYGIGRITTPDLPEPDITMPKVRRKSGNGLEMFK